MTPEEDKSPKLPIFHKNLPVTIHTSLLIALLAMVWACAVTASKWENRLSNLEDVTEYSVEDHYRMQYIVSQLDAISKLLEKISK